MVILNLEYDSAEYTIRRFLRIKEYGALTVELKEDTDSNSG